MNFANGKALYLLILLIPLAMLMVTSFRRKKKHLSGFMAQEAQQKMVVRSSREVDFIRSLLIILGFSFLILALARPQWGERFESLDIRGLQIVFLLDTSNSMAAEDLRPSRLESAKSLICTCVDTLKSDLVALIDFAASGYVQCPLTSDYEAFKLLTEAASISPSEEQGTDFASAFTLALKTFKNRRGSQNLAILITDGEDQEKKWQNLLPQLKNEKIVAFAVGVGIPGGAPIPIKDGKGKTIDWKKDKSGNLVKTMLDEGTLIKIASETGGQYFRLTEAAGIQEFMAILQSFERKTLAQKIKSAKIDRFYYPLIAAIILLFLEMILTDKKVQWKNG